MAEDTFETPRNRAAGEELKTDQSVSRSRVMTAK